MHAVPLGAAEARKPRRATLPYALTDENVAIGLPGPGPGPEVTDSEAEYEFHLAKGERWVSVTILDDSEGPVAGLVSQWVTDSTSSAGGGSATTRHPVQVVHFCTETPAPVRVKPDIPIEISIKDGTCEDGTPSVPTSGDIVVDFFRGRP